MSDVHLLSDETADTEDATETVGLLVGGSGQPQIPSDLVENIDDAYIQPNFSGTDSQPLGTPQQLYPISGVHNGFFDSSVQSDVDILDDEIHQQLDDGNHVVVYGQSQGATAETIEMQNLAASDDPPDPDEVSFVMTGDPDLPNGGMLERFNLPDLPNNAPDDLPGNLTLPTLGTSFFGATPPDSPYETVTYTGEYDGFADFPQYPINLLADLNALLGIVYVHGPMEQLSASEVDEAFEWETSPGYDGDTTYYIIPTDDLPLLEPLRGDAVGDAFADLLQPDLKVLVNLGYGSDNLPYSEHPDVPTPESGLFPDADPATVFDNLIDGAKEGIGNFVADLDDLSPSDLVGEAADPGDDIEALDLDADNLVPELQTVLSDNAEAIGTLFAAPLDTVMPAIDIATAVVTELPTVTANLMLGGLGQLADGDAEAAFADFTAPIGGSTGLLSIAGFEYLSTIQEAVQRISDTFDTASAEDASFIAGLTELF